MFVRISGIRLLLVCLLMVGHLALAIAPAVGQETRNGDARSRPLPVGESGTVGDYEIRVVKITPDATDAVMAENMFNDPPGAGNVFFMVRIEAAYTGRDEGTPWIDLSLSVVGDRNLGYSESQASCGVIPDEAHNLPDLFEGATVEFNACWQVPEDEIDSLVMYVEESFSFDDGRVWFSLDEPASPKTRTRPVPHDIARGDVHALEAIDILYSPTMLEVNPGDTIEFANAGVLEHGFNVDDLGINGISIASGETTTITIPDDAAPGEYEFYCHIPGHKEAGMVGTLVVTGDADAAATPAAEPGGGDANGVSTETIEIEAGDLYFEPNTISVAPGDTIVMTNVGVLQHDMASDALGGTMIGLLSAGESGEFVIPEDASGEIDIYCTVAGHKEAGMIGTFTVVGSPDSVPPETETPEGGEKNDASRVTVKVEAGDLYFDPDTVKVAPGDTVVVTNAGMLEHNMVVDAWGGELVEPLTGGESASFVVPMTAEPGTTVEFICSIPGHKEAGMTGTFEIVEPDDGR